MTRYAVLVVDDEPGMRDTLVAILEHHGYRVSSACDAEAALSAVQATAFDVVVMDIRMPGRDGVSRGSSPSASGTAHRSMGKRSTDFERTSSRSAPSGAHSSANQPWVGSTSKTETMLGPASATATLAS